MLFWRPCAFAVILLTSMLLLVFFCWRPCFCWCSFVGIHAFAEVLLLASMLLLASFRWRLCFCWASMLLRAFFRWCLSFWWRPRFCCRFLLAFMLLLASFRWYPSFWCMTSEILLSFSAGVHAFVGFLLQASMLAGVQAVVADIQDVARPCCCWRDVHYNIVVAL